MKIVNIDVKEDCLRSIDFKKACEYVLSVVRPLETKLLDDSMHDIVCCHEHTQITLPLSPIRTFENLGYANVANLLHTIPIYLRDKYVEDTEVIDEGKIIDLLGAYYPNKKADNPYIELFMTPILESTCGNDDHFKWLFTKVLIHELSHAALDLNNREWRRGADDKVMYSTEFGKWREESMANALTLRIIKEYGDKAFYDYTKAFMLAQPQEYALGVRMEDFGDYWDVRHYMDSKEDGVNDQLKDIWLKYAKGNPTSAGLKMWNEILASQYVYLFNGKYYKDARDLVPDIVKTELDEYERKRKVKMSFAEFKDIFPYIKTGAEMSYEPTDKVKDDTRYSFVAQLKDGNYSLYYFWDNRTLHEFVSKSSCKFTEFCNY